MIREDAEREAFSPMSALPPKADISRTSRNVRFVRWSQLVDATLALNLSAGISNSKVLRGRSLSRRATLFRWACEYTDRSVLFGKYCVHSIFPSRIQVLRRPVEPATKADAAEPWRSIDLLLARLEQLQPRPLD